MQWPVCVLVDLPCTSKLNVKSRVIKPLAVGLFDWKLFSPARVTLVSHFPSRAYTGGHQPFKNSSSSAGPV